GLSCCGLMPSPFLEVTTSTHIEESHNTMMTALQRMPLVSVIGFLAIFSVLYVGKGLYELLSSSSATEAKDLWTNWAELGLVLNHNNPYEGMPSPSPYPPFTYPANLLFYWPPWPEVRWYFGLVNLACLGMLSIWAYRVGTRQSAIFATAMALSIPATAAVST